MSALEQYRAGFEAGALHKERTAYLKAFPAYMPGYWTERQEQEFNVWLEAKREASTEPSDWRERAARACEAELVDATGTDGDTAYNMAISHCIKAIRSLEGAAGALTDDAKDAARYRFMRSEATGDFLRFCPYGAPAEIDKAIDAAISAHTKAGSGK